MNVKQLIETLSLLDDDMEVWICGVRPDFSFAGSKDVVIDADNNRNRVLFVTHQTLKLWREGKLRKFEP